MVMHESGYDVIADLNHIRMFQERQDQRLHDGFMYAIRQGDSALIEKYLKMKDIKINTNEGEALRTLLDKGDYVNAAKLLDADALTKFTKISPSEKGFQVTDTDILADRQITKGEIYSLANTKQHKHKSLRHSV
jgi:hypothetical protein